ncbi:MAG: hypothetical protein A3F54_00545 [Candidatus Kerfeldbacteria bacterium RIFCSPHIGHO2_12_FULL_48_17]|uniref:Uncharacterized protein n=1 Tax=Candidatus Kerfeldbacteria bacterium RIFCSPHIGHO2_12_FULL_48_17 TaxID=1798542 RepID=A0A1G2B873_9BACT|nr:MAG: hypothetical protein A3F54_00545 [Candidatus Kerfeldbacteria bacterium RIFCSPHIGHO2_12_FULL_48_17]
MTTQKHKSAAIALIDMLLVKKWLETYKHLLPKGKNFRREAVLEAQRLRLECFEPFEMSGKKYCVYRSISRDETAPPSICFKNDEWKWQVLDGQVVEDGVMDASLKQMGQAQNALLLIAEMLPEKNDRYEDVFQIGDYWFLGFEIVSLKQNPPNGYANWSEYIPEWAGENYYWLLIREAKPWDHNLVANFLRNWHPPKIYQGAPSPSCSGGRGPSADCNEGSGDPEGPIEKPIDTRPDPAPEPPPAI